MAAETVTQRSSPEPGTEPPVGVATRMSIFTRLFAIQASWNYELLMGTGIGFCVEPALRHLPGGPNGREYHEALARESHYFNAHPYLASVAVGALSRAELDHVPGSRIDRFRTALCGPLGSVGDRLIWAGWLPVCSLAALAAYGLGARPLTVLVIFLGAYNVVHVGLRAWGVHAGWTHSMRVAPALSGRLFRSGPAYLARVGCGARRHCVARRPGSGHWPRGRPGSGSGRRPRHGAREHVAGSHARPHRRLARRARSPGGLRSLCDGDTAWLSAR